MIFDIIFKKLSELSSVLTISNDDILIDKVYRHCKVSVKMKRVWWLI